MTHAATDAAGSETESEFVRESRKGYVGLTLFLGFFLFMGSTVSLQSGPPDVTLSATRLGVRSGAYGVQVALREIEAVRLLQRMSDIGRKQNAFQSGSTYAGRFEMMPHGSTLLFIDASQSPFLPLRWRGTVLIFNARNAATTRAVFDALSRTAAHGSAR